jgi:hypothetical protein
VFGIGFYTSSQWNEDKILNKTQHEITQISTDDLEININKTSNNKKFQKDNSTTHASKVTEAKVYTKLLDIMRNEEILTDNENFKAYTNVTNKLTGKIKYVGEVTRRTIGTNLFETRFFEGGQVETKIDEKGIKHWDKIKYNNGLKAFRYYDHYQKLEKTITTFEGRRVSYTNFSPKSGHAKQRWIHLQNGDLLYSKYVDGIKTKSWKLPDGGDSKKDWVRSL